MEWVSDPKYTHVLPPPELEIIEVKPRVVVREPRHAQKVIKPSISVDSE
jgi:hypothetical protein